MDDRSTACFSALPLDEYATQVSSVVRTVGVIRKRTQAHSPVGILYGKKGAASGHGPDGGALLTDRILLRAEEDRRD